MISFWKTVNGKMESLEDIEDNCWINMIRPDDVEIRKVTQSCGVDPAVLRAALDEEETSYVDVTDDGHTFITLDIPIVDDTADLMYSTIPLGIVLTKEHIITVCLKDNMLLSEFENTPPKNLNTYGRTQFILALMLRVANRYLQYLRQMNRISNGIEEKLYVSQRNKEVIELLAIQKSLVFFSTSLKANQTTLDKILKGKALKLTEDDTETLEDVMIEGRQAIEMCNIYSDILSGTMDAFASMISNNLNVIMKALTVITMLLTIPTMVFSYYGMNMGPDGLSLFMQQHVWFPFALATVLVIVFGLLFKKFLFSKRDQ
ncbi:MAG: magnesium transporter CorA family protein [Methanomassiliicoccaceae archaeon]|nr:magnesium transporter CorA family protein [Methanomassiliicoccaceae archaeon]